MPAALEKLKTERIDPRSFHCYLVLRSSMRYHNVYSKGQKAENLGGIEI